MKLIISGIPCCRKTHFGDWLRDEHGFAHANLEPRRGDRGPVWPPTISAELPNWLAYVATNVVVTWGFPPNQTCLALIKQFEDAGFIAWWFEADYSIARERYMRRDGIEKTESFFDPQIQSITQAASDLDSLYCHHKIETLTNDGYKSPEEIFAVLGKQQIHRHEQHRAPTEADLVGGDNPPI